MTQYTAKLWESLFGLQELWLGTSGAEYRFTVYPLESQDPFSFVRPRVPACVPEVSGIYILARQNWNGWEALDIGESGEEEGVRGRLVGHESSRSLGG